MTEWARVQIPAALVTYAIAMAVPDLLYHSGNSRSMHYL